VLNEKINGSDLASGPGLSGPKQEHLPKEPGPHLRNKTRPPAVQAAGFTLKTKTWFPGQTFPL